MARGLLAPHSVQSPYEGLLMCTIQLHPWAQCRPQLMYEWVRQVYVSALVMGLLDS